jgi:hypothetical protein
MDDKPIEAIRSQLVLYDSNRKVYGDSEKSAATLDPSFCLPFLLLSFLTWLFPLRSSHLNCPSHLTRSFFFRSIALLIETRIISCRNYCTAAFISRTYYVAVFNRFESQHEFAYILHRRYRAVPSGIVCALPRAICNLTIIFE